MAVTYRATSTANASLTAVTTAFPTGHVVGDIILCVVQTDNENAGAVPTATGATFVEVTNSPQGAGTAAAAGSVGLRVYWARDGGAASGNISVPDSGDHTITYATAYSGVRAVGNPWDISGGSTNTGTTTTATFTTVTTTLANTLVVLACANAVDSTTSQYSSNTAGNLGSVTNRSPTVSNSTVGNGGGITVLDGTLAVAGATGAPALTMVASSANYALMVIALAPALIKNQNGLAYASILKEDGLVLTSVKNVQGLI